MYSKKFLGVVTGKFVFNLGKVVRGSRVTDDDSDDDNDDDGDDGNGDDARHGKGVAELLTTTRTMTTMMTMDTARG